MSQIKNSINFRLNKGLNNPNFWGLLAFSTLIGLCGVYLTRDYIMDDALITIRYSYNFAKFGIPIWNQADLESPSMGYTSILWMLINTIPAFIMNDKFALVVTAQIFSFISLATIISLISHEINILSIPLPLKFMGGFIIFSQLGYGLHVNSAMETMLFSSMILMTVLYYAKGHYRLAYIFGALSFLTRPEGAILSGLLFFWDLINRRIKQAFLGGGVFILLVAVILSLLYFWYGDVLPNTYYAKQELLSMNALVRSVFFIATLALPFLIMAIYAVFYLKNQSSTYMFFSAVVYIVYYISVDPVMNVMSRYQWPSLVLLTCASMPTLEVIGINIRKYKIAVTLLSFLFISSNAGNALGASYFASTEGHAMNNLIIIGEKMGEHRNPEKWLIYHDAGAICYFSDWNTHETTGLTNGPFAKGQIRLDDIYENPDAEIVLRNFDLMSEAAQENQLEFAKKLSAYGYRHIQDIPILFVSGQRNFVVSIYARDVNFANSVFQNINITAPLQPNISYYFYSFAKKLIGR